MPSLDDFIEKYGIHTDILNEWELKPRHFLSFLATTENLLAIK